MLNRHWNDEFRVATGWYKFASHCTRPITPQHLSVTATAQSAADFLSNSTTATGFNKCFC
ncbi:hypothetical protein GCM10011297_13840 [Bacterioplanes sanyensis]|nr:hypothetical protein GCM10011297_13840 [Bacterioplanes sanyensis]